MEHRLLAGSVSTIKRIKHIICPIFALEVQRLSLAEVAASRQLAASNHLKQPTS